MIPATLPQLFDQIDSELLAATPQMWLQALEEVEQRAAQITAKPGYESLSISQLLISYYSKLQQYVFYKRRYHRQAAWWEEDSRAVGKAAHDSYARLMLEADVARRVILQDLSSICNDLSERKLNQNIGGIVRRMLEGQQINVGEFCRVSKDQLEAMEYNRRVKYTEMLAEPYDNLLANLEHPMSSPGWIGYDRPAVSLNRPGSGKLMSGSEHQSSIDAIARHMEDYRKLQEKVKNLPP